MNARDAVTAYTVDDGAPRSAVESCARAVLVAVRPRLATLSIDLVSDDPWPERATGALATLERHRRTPWLFRSRKHITADVDATDDEQFHAALVVAPYTICATGITSKGRAVYNVDDTGRSMWFELTETEVVTARNYMAAQGEDPSYLRPVPPR